MTPPPRSADIALKLDQPTTTSRPAGLRRLVDIEQLADHLGVSVRHVRRLVSERRIPFHKWGRLVRFDIDEVNKWLDQTRVEAERRD
jgi:excisionase family DNA binding protein